jgi:uncharacterized protein YjbI with pentapeptide repeats
MQFIKPLMSGSDGHYLSRRSDSVSPRATTTPVMDNKGQLKLTTRDLTISMHDENVGFSQGKELSVSVQQDPSVHVKNEAVRRSLENSSYDERIEEMDLETLSKKKSGEIIKLPFKPTASAEYTNLILNTMEQVLMQGSPIEQGVVLQILVPQINQLQSAINRQAHLKNVGDLEYKISLLALILEKVQNFNEHGYFEYVDLSGKNLFAFNINQLNLNLSHGDFTFTNFRNSNLSNTNFSEAIFDDTILTLTTLESSILPISIKSNKTFKDSDSIIKKHKMHFVGEVVSKGNNAVEPVQGQETHLDHIVQRNELENRRHRQPKCGCVIC